MEKFKQRPLAAILNRRKHSYNKHPSSVLLLLGSLTFLIAVCLSPLVSYVMFHAYSATNKLGFSVESIALLSMAVFFSAINWWAKDILGHCKRALRRRLKR